ncbi:cysteine synthase A [candidate division KSB1 bacterium]|nr:cysteine synthase A [candidate division KSB1 bacterium]RQW11819.1 MAG: cysteine synthase A [candidate division KSB1 bacterium]
MHTIRVLDAIGNTPMVKLQSSSVHNIFAKAEFLNPGGSIKDRVAKYLIEGAERDGMLTKDSIIAEPSSGNTGIGLALVGVQKGYRVIIVMPENMSEERKKIIRAFGGEIIHTPTKDNMQGSINKIKELQETDSSIFVPQQFENPRNPEIHYLTTAREIWTQLDGRIDAFVAGVGSGGTIGGVGRFLKEQNPDIKVIAVEPENCAALLGREPGLHQIQGIGDGFIPSVLDVSLIDDVITVTDDDAIRTTRMLAKKEGLLVGTSSGANVWAAKKLARSDKNIVTVLVDRAERYFSTSLL